MTERDEGPLTQADDNHLAAFDRLSTTLGRYKSGARARFRAQQTFAGIDLAGKSVLEIGAGSGVLSAYAAISGARRVVALEPAEEGSTPGTDLVIDRMAAELGLPGFEVRHETIQTYSPSTEPFDVVLSYNSVNHLDEQACVRLLDSDKAVAAYRAIFDKIAAMVRPGGHLIIADCTRYNAFGMLGLKNPVMPTIQWHLHQTPETWAAILSGSGFKKERVVATTLYPLRRLGKLAANRLVDFFTVSHFLAVFRLERGR